ncbi:MAG TPA: MBL fold metallo-hydrolase, partial [Candidatus Saccharimonadales bacterium]|nr:MBL fold metallo-hydrolase [Candidatus Saccharimonadales bacterium]
MKITKFVHSCLLVEMPAPVNRTALFDPGTMNTLDIDSLEFLDDIIITHVHNDHFDIETVKKLVQKFSNVRITSTPEVVQQLSQENISATSESSEGIEFFESPHESMEPLGQPPQEIGVH